MVLYNYYAAIIKQTLARNNNLWKSPARTKTSGARKSKQSQRDTGKPAKVSTQERYTTPPSIKNRHDIPPNKAQPQGMEADRPRRNPSNPGKG